jgi:regulator of sigma E protease
LSVSPETPAARAGLQTGDVILGLGGERAPKYERILETIKASENRELTFQIERDGREQAVAITPVMMEGAPKIGAVINPFEVRTVEPGPVEAVRLSVVRNWEWSKMIVVTLKGLFTRDTSVKQLMGPVAIADQSRIAASQGWVALLNLMALISLNLGLLNLMPIPVLDGGHILILALEGLARRDFSIAVKEKMLLAGFAVLVLLMVTVIFNDLTRISWIQRVLPWR